MKLCDVLKDNKTQKEIQAAIIKGNVQINKGDVLALCGSQYNPSPELCRLILKHGDEAKRQETSAFMVGMIVEYKSLRMTEEAHALAEILLEHFSEVEADALEAAEKAVAAASAAPLASGKGK